MLFVCTGNTCRSPMAEGLLRAQFLAAGIEGTITSAGTLGWSGNPATPHAVEVLAQREIDISAHTSRKLTDDLVDGADLIIAMTRNHAWAVAARSAEARGRTFLPGELARLVGEHHHQLDTASPDRWVTQLSAARGGHMVLGRVADEVDDPAGEPIEVYIRTADRLEAQTRRLTAMLSATR